MMNYSWPILVSIVNFEQVNAVWAFLEIIAHSFNTIAAADRSSIENFREIRKIRKKYLFQSVFFKTFNIPLF